jgi:hypothetical protein
MLTTPQQRAVDRFAKSLPTLADEALIDAFHQAWEDHRDARAEGSDNLDKACAESLATEQAMRERFPDYQRRYMSRYPLTSDHSGVGSRSAHWENPPADRAWRCVGITETEKPAANGKENYITPVYLHATEGSLGSLV